MRERSHSDGPRTALCRTPSEGGDRRSRVTILVALLVTQALLLAAAQVPPPWQVGLRLTWQGGGSTLQGSRFVPDPNGWIWQNGQWGRIEGTSGGGGVGLVQLTVLSADATGIVGDVRHYLSTDPQRNAYVSSGNDAVLGDATSVYPYWLAPARLAAMQPGFDGLTRVWRGTRTLNGVALDTVSMATMSQGSYTSFTYDVASGLLVFGGSMDAQPGVLVTDPNGNVLQQNAGAVSYTHLLFLGARQLQVPWAGQPLPEWLVPGRSLLYQGQLRLELPGGGLPPLPGQALAVAYRLDRQVGVALLGQRTVQAATTQGLPPDQTTGNQAFGSTAFDGVWVPPAALASMLPDQALDQDPYTGMRVVFGGVQGGLALLVMQGSDDSLEQYYDLSSGVLAFSRYRKAVAGVGVQVSELQLAGQQ